MSADHYAVTTDELGAGAGKVGGLSDEAQTAATALLETIATLANSAGNGALASSLGRLGTAAAQSSTVLVTVLTQVADTISQNAATYQRQEDRLARQIARAR